MRTLLKLAFREVTRRKTASFFTFLGLMIGTSSLLLLLAFGQGGKKQIAGELEETGLVGLRVSKVQESGPVQMTSADLELLRSAKGVERAVPILTAFGTAKAAGKHGDCLLWGADAGSAQLFSVTLLEGRLLQKEDMEAEADVCLVDRVFARSFYHRENIVGRTLSLTLNGREKEYEVVGVVSSGGALTQGILGSFVPAFVYLPYPAMEEQGGFSGFPNLAVSLNPTENKTALMEKTAAYLTEKSDTPGRFLLEDLEEKSALVGKIMDTLTWMLLAMGSLTLLVAGLSVFLTMQSSVRQRQVEIGIQKALGAEGKDIALQFLFEAGILSFFGGLGGLLVALLLLLLLQQAAGLSFFPAPLVLLLTVPLVTLFGALCGLIPAKNAAACDPAEAFRSL